MNLHPRSIRARERVDIGLLADVSRGVRTQARIMQPKLKSSEDVLDRSWDGRLRLLALLAIAGQVVLVGSAWLLPIPSEFRLVGDTVSELVLGRYGAVQTAAFVLAGLGTLGLAVAIRALTTELRGSLVGSLLVAVYGVGAVLVAVFPTDRIDRPDDAWSQSAAGLVHLAVSAVSFLCVVVGMLVLTWIFRRTARWRPLLIWQMLAAGGALSLLFVQAQGPFVGLMQRGLVSLIAIWLVLAALGVLRTRHAPRLHLPAWPAPDGEQDGQRRGDQPERSGLG